MSGVVDEKVGVESFVGQVCKEYKIHLLKVPERWRD